MISGCCCCASSFCVNPVGPRLRVGDFMPVSDFWDLTHFCQLSPHFLSDIIYESEWLGTNNEENLPGVDRTSPCTRWALIDLAQSRPAPKLLRQSLQVDVSAPAQDLLRYLSYCAVLVHAVPLCNLLTWASHLLASSPVPSYLDFMWAYTQGSYMYVGKGQQSFIVLAKRNQSSQHIKSKEQEPKHRMSPIAAHITHPQ